MSDSTSRLLRGFLEPCLLALLAPSPDYGLSLMRRLSAAGLVSTSTRPSASGPARKYYELTSAGRAELAGRREEWRAFRAAFSAVLEGAAMSAEVNA